MNKLKLSSMKVDASILKGPWKSILKVSPDMDVAPLKLGADLVMTAGEKLNLKKEEGF